MFRKQQDNVELQLAKRAILAYSKISTYDGPDKEWDAYIRMVDALNKCWPEDREEAKAYARQLGVLKSQEEVK